MNRRLTRRAMAKLLAAAPVLLAAEAAAEPVERRKPAGPAFTQKEKAAIAKGVTGLKKSLGDLHKMPIPIGTEPAFVFSPLVRKK
jgi:hypothetical protein